MLNIFTRDADCRANGPGGQAVTHDGVDAGVIDQMNMMGHATVDSTLIGKASYDNSPLRRPARKILAHAYTWIPARGIRRPATFAVSNVTLGVTTPARGARLNATAPVCAARVTVDITYARSMKENMSLQHSRPGRPMTKPCACLPRCQGCYFA